jgi:hypothetical protein
MICLCELGWWEINQLLQEPLGTSDLQIKMYYLSFMRWNCYTYGTSEINHYLLDNMLLIYCTFVPYNPISPDGMAVSHVRSKSSAQHRMFQTFIFAFHSHSSQGLYSIFCLLVNNTSLYDAIILGPQSNNLVSYLQSSPLQGTKGA